MNWLQVNPVINYAMRELCVKPYYGHPKGCINYNKKDHCPPSALWFDLEYDLSQPVYAVINRFNIGAHIGKMHQKHSNWSDRQLRNCLYWQPRARKELRKHIKDFILKNPGYIIAPGCPGAMGIDVTATLQSAGIILEWPPQNVAYQVALAAKRMVKYI